MGGVLIKLLRNPLPPDSHASEGALDDLPDDYWTIVLDNRTMTIDEQNAAMMQELRPIIQEYLDESH